MSRYLAATFEAVRVRDFRLYAIGQVISVCGTWMQKLAQGWLILVITDSGLLLGVTAALQQLPTTLFTTFGGRLADRYDKKRILVLTAIAAAIPALLIGVVVMLGVVEVWMVMAAALVQGFADALDRPARLTVVNDIAPPEVLTNAIALNSMIQSAGKVAGPALAGILIGTVGLSAAFLVNAASFLPVILVLVLIRTPRATRAPAPRGMGGSTLATLRYVAERPNLIAALALMFVTGLLATNWSVLLPILIRDSFGGDAATTGLAFTMMGLGGTIGGLVLAGVLRPSNGWLLTHAFAFSVLFLALAGCPWLGVTHALLFALGATGVAMRATAASILQVQSDPHMRGQVISLLVLCMAGTTPLGGPLIGYLSEITDPRVACVVGGVSTALATVAAMRYLRRSSGAPVQGGTGGVSDVQTTDAQASNL